MVKFSGLFPRGNIPLNKGQWGSYFPTGVRVGPSWDKNSRGEDRPNFSNWGEGVPLATNFTYPISPWGTGIEVSLILGPTTTGNKTLQAASSEINSGAAWSSVCAGGEYGIQFDWPRAIQAQVVTASGDPLPSPVDLHIFGYDFYGQAMQSKISEIQAYGLYSPILRSSPVEVTTNKAFYQITRVRLTGNLPADSALIVTCCACFGLPYTYAFGVSMPTSIYWRGVSELTCSALNAPLAPLAEAQLTAAYTGNPANNSGDVRGTYIPSTDPEPDDLNYLLFQYYVVGGDPIINQFWASGLPESPGEFNSDSVTKLDPTILYGARQYFTGTPV